MYARRWLLSLFFLATATSQASDHQDWFATLSSYPHATKINQSQQTVRDFEVGVGALEKVRGVWRFKASMRKSGELQRATWQITDGYSAAEVFERLVEQLREQGNIETLFECSGRSCGPSVQWANRVFEQRLLYGRDNTQLYAAFASSQEISDWVMVVYAAGRTVDRQYVHMDWLQTQDP